jgi:hypothetical protein
MVDFRLYLPKIWIDDPRRCRKAGIPKEEQVFRTKCQLAPEFPPQFAREFPSPGLMSKESD